MSAFLPILGSALIAIGLFFMVTGAIGVIRMPDVFTRQHAAGMTDTGGAASGQAMPITPQGSFIARVT